MGSSPSAPTDLRPSPATPPYHKKLQMFLFTTKRAGISTETIFAIEHGRRQPTVTTLDKIAKALDVEVKDFFS
jgi:Helix-turn-helix